MLEQFRKYEIKNTRSIFGRTTSGDEPDIENQFTLDCPGTPNPNNHPGSMEFCLPTLEHP